ncbi:MAG: DNA methyltransferase [Candidatus Kuenenia sp.]|nr:DNA methyltransferase [Candidatus Kuenenia sp.]
MSNINLYNSDCLLAMAKMEDKQFELAIVDPPYNIVSQQARGIGSRIDATGKMNSWNNIKPSPEYFSQLFRVSVNQIVWGANNFTMPESEYFIVWDKQQTVPNFASAEYAWTNIRIPAKVFRYSIHQHNCDKGKKIHPTMKPIKLYQWLLKNYAKPGDHILDTHLGSGSSAIACDIMGYDMVGYEIDKDYYEAAKARLERHQMQGKLFG